MPGELDPLTYDVLDHIARYRIGVPEALVRTPPFAALSLKRVKRTLHALTEGEGEVLLASAPLYGDHRYFYLTRAGEAVIGEPDAGQGKHRKAGRSRRWRKSGPTACSRSAASPNTRGSGSRRTSSGGASPITTARDSR